MIARLHMKFQGHAQLQGPTDSRQWMGPENKPMLARMREDCRIPKKVLKARPKLGERGIWTSVYARVHYMLGCMLYMVLD